MSGPKIGLTTMVPLPHMFPKVFLEVTDLMIGGSIFFLTIPTARSSICYPGRIEKLKLLGAIY
jgi:hypothetical protein